MRVEFKFDANLIKSQIGEGVKEKTERVTQELLDRIIANSPVRTGNFRASWNVTEGVAIFLDVSSGDPAFPLSAPNYRVRALTDFPVFYITNGKEYGVYLEYGTQHMQPYAVVRSAIASMK